MWFAIAITPHPTRSSQQPESTRHHGEALHGNGLRHQTGTHIRHHTRRSDPGLSRHGIHGYTGHRPDLNAGFGGRPEAGQVFRQSDVIPVFRSDPTLEGTTTHDADVETDYPGSEHDLEVMHRDLDTHIALLTDIPDRGQDECNIKTRIPDWTEGMRDFQSRHVETGQVSSGANTRYASLVTENLRAKRPNQTGSKQIKPSQSDRRDVTWSGQVWRQSTQRQLTSLGRSRSFTSQRDHQESTGSHVIAAKPGDPRSAEQSKEPAHARRIDYAGYTPRVTCWCGHLAEYDGVTLKGSCSCPVSPRQPRRQPQVSTVTMTTYIRIK